MNQFFNNDIILFKKCITFCKVTVLLQDFRMISRCYLVDPTRNLIKYQESCKLKTIFLVNCTCQLTSDIQYYH